MNYEKEALLRHGQWGGKLRVVPSMAIENMDDMSVCYTPGVAAPC
jgi:malate dehydrogenase (oxaloacetate-decarboxylating)